MEGAERSCGLGPNRPYKKTSKNSLVSGLASRIHPAALILVETETSHIRGNLTVSSQHLTTR